MVCYMYYTDVFVGHNNIEKLNKALEAVLPSFNSNALTQLVQGLCLFMGYPSCVCSLKANVDKSLQDISGKLLKDSEAVQSCLQKTLNLNCSCSSEEILCKCCVISCIKELPGQSQCPCLSNTSTDCQCKGTPKKCCKDVLSGLEACLSLLNLKTDMQGCTCPPDCCKTGTCTNKSCKLCSPDKSTITGLGLSRPNPIRLAKRLSEMLCGTRESGQKCLCGCGSGSPNTSCCCFCHSDCKTGKFSGECSKACPGCSCASKPGECGLKDFCKSINSIRVLVGSSAMTCCEGGKNCHCGLEGSSKCSGSNCCVVSCSTNGHFQHSVKCMILRVVKFFASFDASSQPKSSCLCCELICVGKYCDFLKMFFDRSNRDVCETCKSGGSGGKPCPGSKITPAPSPSCCGGASPCNSDCCLGCQDCDAIKFRKALQELQYSSPCGQDLYRTLKDFLDYCLNVAEPFIKSAKKKIEEAKGKCISGCKSTGGKPCSCSQTSGSCLGCKALRGHKDIMSVLTRKFSSSYDSSNAKWDSLCSSKPCCSNPSCPCPRSGPSCPDNGCCEKCPKRLCAKIFLGMLPCLYYGLKILWVRCKYGSEFPDWYQKNGQKNLVPASILHAPDLKKFLDAWGFESSHLDPSLQAMVLPGLLGNLFNASFGKFKSLLDFVSKKYFSIHVSDASKSKPPTTVRQMLLWLYGLRFQKHFSDLVENCKSLCSPFGNSFHPDAFCYYIHTCSFILPVAIISFIEDSSSAQKAFSSSSEISKFLYPSDPSKLFETFCEYVRKIFAALNFLSIQCRLDRDLAGWQDCYFGRGCAQALQNSLKSTPATSASSSCCPTSLPKGILCASIPGISNCHEHCINGKTCIGLKPCTDNGSGKPKTDKDAHTSNQCTASCPHPLQRFLTHGSESNSKDYPFGLSGITPMGFDQEKLPKEARRGYSLYHDIEPFCKDGFYPLTRLVQFILCVSQRPPESFLDLYAFFVKFKDSDVFKNDFASYASGEPGTPDGSALQDAVQGLYGSSHSSGDHSVASLFSLSSCHANKGSNAACGAYLFPLTNNVAGVFTPELCSMYLSWICYRGPTFYSEFKAFYDKAQGKFSSCCSSGSCKNIVKCPCALPFIYSQGFTFMSPSSLACVNAQGQEHKNNDGSEKHSGDETNAGCTRKTCSQFLAQLKLVVDGQPFKALLKEIERFLWHIRLPFFFGFLYVWFFVLSYFFYVILIKLDTFHTGSHLHLPRSFKILPSTLFSDASSKLKDLSYFTL
ncbi:variant erythrocyte surface antigen-1 family protein [Babesia divergens]|uniref:Variant erythrocyte surface antigen-1 family protein n=1 Tax=Babesia divergens TaxID=32595 RepID=A0AAD9GIE0_BABDI|nr:variant erythrocyte surface antigen-1 family protein [Babesia divergens]